MVLIPSTTAIPPPNNVGSLGDSYKDNATGTMWVKLSSGWVVTSGGHPNLPRNGASFLAGLGAPAPGTGDVGDSYLDWNTALVWIRTISAWTCTNEALVSGVPVIETTPTDDLLLAFPASGNSAYVLHPPVGRNITLRIDTGSVRASLRQKLSVDVVSLPGTLPATVGSITLSLLGLVAPAYVVGMTSTVLTNGSSITFTTLGDSAGTIIAR